MRYRRLGDAGVRVSAVGLGSWLTYGGSVEKKTARECIARAYDLGVNFFDTANVYGRGEAERVVGEALRSYARESYVLATKVYFPMGEGPNDRGLSRKHVIEQCHASLDRLNVGHIDLYQCHRYDDDTPLEETCEAMNDLLRQGKILYWGVSEWSAEEISDAVETCLESGWTPPVSNQPEYNALQRGIEDDVLPLTEELGIGNVVWSPLAQGVLTGKYETGQKVPAGSRAAGEAAGFMGRYLRPEILGAVGKLRALAADSGCSPGQLAIAWCLRQPQVSSVIVGATRVGHVEENVAAGDLGLGPDIFAQVDEILEPVAVERE
ncbi:MAG TPA: aldo/keto reductase family protein [Gemmatimonadota bacterium]|nr:aldo/keto reductase family protein [Gemmatimonadota bacterium]